MKPEKDVNMIRHDHMGVDPQSREALGKAEQTILDDGSGPTQFRLTIFNLTQEATSKVGAYRYKVQAGPSIVMFG